MTGESSYATASTCFLTAINSKEEGHQARVLMESLRSFGGELKDCPIWVFSTTSELSDGFSDLGNVDLIPLSIEDEFRSYDLSGKVFACARAEEMAQAEVQSLVWLNINCLIVNPPVLFELPPFFDVAIRPVHLKNVGSPAREPLDDFWKGIYQAIGVDDIPFTTESFVDSHPLRPYFNTHCFSVNPAKGALRAWREYFKLMVSNKEFQSGPCHDGLHQLFLHQAVLSALIVKLLDRERIRILPPEYSYPIHLQQKIPQHRRHPTLNSLVCAAYEDKDHLNNIEVQEPLKSWIMAH